MSTPALRPARPGDEHDILAMIRELAQFEHLSHLVENTPQQLADSLFGAAPAAEAWLACDADGQALGFALFFQTYSTFLGKPGLWLEDLYVRPAYRGRGIGEALLRQGACLALARGHGRYEWSVLDWNEGAQRFYRRMGATVMPDWRIVRTTGDALRTLADPAHRGQD